MDLGGTDVILDFQFPTIQKTHQFFRDLMEHGQASFNLSACALHPSVVQTDDKWQGVIDWKFGARRFCEEFDATARPVFFPTFAHEMLDEKRVLRLTAEANTAAEIVSIMNIAFDRLNVKTHYEVGNLLNKNGDPQFLADRPSPERDVPPHRDPHYFVEPDGTVQKEVLKHGEGPEGRIRQWDEWRGEFHALKRLPQLTEADVYRIMAKLSTQLEFAKKLSERSDSIAAKINGDMRRLQEELERTEPRSPLDLEVLGNFLKSGKTVLSGEDLAIAKDVHLEMQFSVLKPDKK
jgi:hypothetical protein